MNVKQAKELTPFQIAREILDELAFTAAVRDLPTHAQCMSRNLRVYGVPGVDSLDYNGWYTRRRNELVVPLLFSLNYRDMELVSSDDVRIHVTVSEVMKSMDGRVMVLDKEIAFGLEPDQHWRVLSERITRARFGAHHE